MNTIGNRGSTPLVLNENAQIQEAMSYLAYGAIKSLIKPAAENKARQKFTGKELDEDGKVLDGDGEIVCAGMMLNYFGVRYYDADVGQWIAVDPKGQFWSPYLYVGNGYNALVGIDPDGAFVGTIIGGGIGAIGGAFAAYFNKTDVVAGAICGAASGMIAGAALDITVATAGAAGPAIGALLIAGAAGGGVGNAVGSASEQYMNNGSINWGSVGVSSLIGAGAGLLGGGTSAFTQAAATSTKHIANTAGKMASTVPMSLLDEGALGAASSVNAAYISGSSRAAMATANISSYVESAGAAVTKASDLAATGLLDQ